MIGQWHDCIKISDFDSIRKGEASESGENDN